MKKLISLLIPFVLSGLASSVSFAAETRYCDDMARVNNFPHLSSDQFARHLEAKGSVDRILVSKARRELYLLKDDVVLKTYHVAFGMDPLGGHKQFEGDSKTPEGIYTIDGKNPNSAYYLSLHVSYPNAADVAFAKSRGRSPGGNIMIHGFPVIPAKHIQVQQIHPLDWTAGCIAVTDKEINEIYSLVKEKTTIEICKYRDN
ncbi:L,D-transpeptidase family protein [Bdellovibrio svalbardensis]|uniref:L,D-transpeptidase family protein n=1 Tax=Bdellovibrio svalbardensis TaxID=2972972 RepID=A0ABT6DIG4_9BACT|nr:L,D-transpeptidase family protein [Bdellovibrio svalbardensis]MDG0816561.1 L,D-transpeptidase family protein [Bdellovibrio svalbardensis]